MGEKTVAVVSHPGNNSRDVVSALQSVDGVGIHWQHMAEVHMLGRNTADEQTTYDYLLGKTEKGRRHYPDGIFVLVSAKELTRQLYLASQLIDLRLPMAIGFVHVSEAIQDGLSINIEKMGGQLGVKGYDLDLENRERLELLVHEMQESLTGEEPKRPLHWRPSIALADAYHLLDKKWVYKHVKLHSGARLIEGLRLLRVEKAVEEYRNSPAYDELVELVAEARTLLEERNENWAMSEVLQRNSWLGQIISACTTQKTKPPPKKTPFWKRILG